MRFLHPLLEFLTGTLKTLRTLGVILFIAFILAFFMMIFLPEQTQSAFQFFIELLFR